MAKEVNHKISIQLIKKTPKWLRYILFSLLITLGGFNLQNCDKDSPAEPVETPLTEEQKLFESAFDPAHPKLVAKGWVKPSILDGKPVVTVPVSPVPNNTNFTEAFKGFMDIEIRLINAKTGSYSLTPIISNGSIKEIFKKGKELQPGKEGYGLSIVTQAINGDIKRSLTPGVWVLDKDDPSTKAVDPTPDVLPPNFLMSEFNKYFTSANIGKSFDLNKEESFNLVMDLTTFGLKFDTIIYPVNPASEALSVIQN